MDTTASYYLHQIERNPNKKHWRVKRFIKEINLLISGYRITAQKFRGKYVGGYCSHEANVLENKLKKILGE